MNYSLVWTTVRYLRATQVVGQVWNRFKKKERAYFKTLPAKTWEVRFAIPELDCDGMLEERFGVELMPKGRVMLLNQMVNLNYRLDYTKKLKPLIYNNVYYFEYGIALASAYNRTGDKKWWELFKKCYEDYLAAKADLKSAYSMALHIPNVMIALELFGNVVDEAFREKVYCELYSQYVYLQAHQEKHLLANHYFEDLKALIIASYLFGEDEKLAGYLKDFKKQCEEQILEDGMHYELSPMYHKLILEDVMRIGMLAEMPGFPECGWIVSLIQKMTDACYSLEMGMGRTPLFNDAGDNVAKTCKQLCLAASHQFGVTAVAINELPASGYYKLYDGNRALLMDAGKIGVNYQPAHGHCDCLSFELAVDGNPLFINSGTYEYQGDLRKIFRKTCAHNTVEIGGREQSQCWGGFRVAKRISYVLGELKGNSIEGSYMSYSGDMHRRVVSLADGVLTVKDRVKTAAGTEIKSYLHIAPDYNYYNGIITNKTTGEAICNVVPLYSTVASATAYELKYYAPEFGDLKIGSCLVFTWQAD